MSLEPLPLGFGDFSITMATDDASLASIWPPTPPPQPPLQLQDLRSYQSVDEVKQRLAAATAELHAVREEVLRKQQRIAAMADLIRLTAQERDLLRQQRQLLIAREMEAMDAIQASATTPTACPLASSSSPVAVDAAAMIKPPFVVQSSAAPTACSLASSSSPMAVDPAPMIQPPFVVPSSAPPVDRSTATAALEVPSFAALVDRSTATAAVDGAAMFKPPFAVPRSSAAVDRTKATAAVDGADMIKPPFAMPRSVAAVVDRSTATLAIDGAAMIKPPFAVPRSSAAVDRSKAAALEVPSFAALVSSAPVAVDRATMIKPPFVVPSSAAAVDRSTAAALEVPSFVAGAASASMAANRAAMIKPPFVVPSSAAAVDRSTVEEPDLLRQQRHQHFAREMDAVTPSQASATPTVCPLTSSSPVPVAVDRAGVIKPPFAVPSSAAVNRSMAAAALEVPSFAGLVSEDKSKVAALELLAAKRPLPQQGRLVQAVMEAGPLLQNMLVAGPLPRWRNPPPAMTDAMMLAPSGSSAPMGWPWSIH